MEDTQRKSVFALSGVATVALEAEIDECHQRLLSGEVVMSTAHSDSWGKRSTSREIATRPFLDAYEAEVERIANILLNKRNTVESSAEALLKNADGLSRRKSLGKLSDPALEKELEQLKVHAKGLQNQTLKIIKETHKNMNELLRISHKADAKLRTNCVDESERVFSQDPWSDTASSGHVVKLISDIFSLIRKIEMDAHAKDGKWVAPAAFKRKTTKYWVRDEDLPEVLLKSASELPILVYGKSGLLTKNPKDPSQSKVEFWKAMASPIVSVYFDSENLDMYRERLKRAEGAQLVRVRWYGKKPSAEKVVFLELKTHHEKWIEEKSVKERVNVLQKRMNTMMDISDGEWTPEFAKKIVLEASPEATEKEITVSVALLLEIRKIFCRLKLKPCVRTSYIRAAFQSPENNNLRLTIDRDITVVDEMRAYNERKSGSSWCIDDDDVVPIDAFVKVPYGVFEVKVSAGENPQFIEELIANDAIVVAHKFSKFLSGVSLHNASKVETLPWWADDAFFAPLYKRTVARRSFSSSKNLGSSMTDISSNNMEKFSVEKSLKSITEDQTEVAYSDESKKEVDLLAAEEGRYLSSGNSGNDTGKGLFSRIGLRSRKKKDGPAVAPKTPVKVEPKTFFANERTFIQWVTNATLLMTSGTIVYSAAIAAGTDGAGKYLAVGHGIMAVAVVIALYGTFIYYRRLYLMTNAKPYGYKDTVGPFVFATMIILVIGITMWIETAQISTPNDSLKEKTDECIRRDLGLGVPGGIPYLQFEPSALVTDPARDILIVGSSDEIVAYPAGLTKGTEDSMQILYRFPDGTEDIEALEMIDGTLYALSEGKKSNGADQSDLIALDWDANGVLTETARWRINAPHAEGMAYIDDPDWFPSGPHLIVASDPSKGSGSNPTSVGAGAGVGNVDGDDLLKITSIPLPFPTNGTLVEKKMNSKFFTQGRLDPKVGDLQFSGGLLWVLYNNDRKVAAFTKEGYILTEWALPVAVPGSGRYWEGLQIDEDVVHLALDTPPQIWSIKAPYGKLPACAATRGQNANARFSEFGATAF